MSRTRQAATVALVVMLAVAPATAPVLAATGSPTSSGTVSPAMGSLEAVVGYDRPGWLVTYGADADPGVYVTVANGSKDALEAWVQASPQRQWLNGSDGSPWVANRTAHLRAPFPRVLGGLHTTPTTLPGGFTVGLPAFPAGLQSQSYVTRIDPAIRAGADPIQQPKGPDAYQRPVPNSVVQGKWTTDGVAFGSDVNVTTLGEARSTVGADGLSGSSTARIAVLDTGLNVANASDPALYGTRVVAAKDFVNNETGLANVTDGSDSLHGSWTAAAVAANATNDSYDGVCPDCELVVGKTLADDGSGSIEQIREGVEWAERQDADIISMSLGSPVYSETLAAEMRAALRGNVTAIYVATGNARMRPVGGRYINSPADVPETGVISVAATTNAPPANASTAYFSSVGPDAARDLSGGRTAGQPVDVAAPGFKIAAPVYTENGYRRNRTLSGTSMATPIAAGVGGLMLASNPSLENDTDAFVGYQLNTSAPVPAAGVTEVGHGMVDAANATTLSPHPVNQSDARSAPARGRDGANRAYSGSQALRFAAGVARRSPI